MVSVVTGNELTQLFAYQSSLYYSQNAHQWTLPPEMLMWSNNTTSEAKEFLDLIILTVQVGKENMKDYWSTNPTICMPVFLPDHEQKQF
jgi:hypothetical protein